MFLHFENAALIFVYFLKLFWFYLNFSSCFCSNCVSTFSVNSLTEMHHRPVNLRNPGVVPNQHRLYTSGNKNRYATRFFFDLFFFQMRSKV